MPVNGTDADAYYFRIVADYIHLNPARAGLAGGRNGPLVGYKWSSLILRKNTTVSNDWIASNLAMGHPGSVSRMISVGRSDRRMSERLHEIHLYDEGKHGTGMLGFPWPKDAEEWLRRVVKWK